MTPTISTTEAGALTALRTFLVGVLAPGVEVIKGQVNRVPEPLGDFVVMTPIGQERIETNETTFIDNVFTGSIAAGVLTVSALTQAEGPLSPGVLITDGTVGAIAANTILGEQLSGTPGGIGTYSVTPSQDLPEGTLYAGTRADLVATQLTVQLDVHGPNATDNVRVIDTLFRSEYGVAAFGAPAYDKNPPIATPLYCEPARQTPFINAEQQYEYRWTIDACLQISPVIGTSQQFAAQLEAGLIEVDASFPP